MIHDLKDMVIMAMACCTVVLCAFFLKECNHKSIHVSCDVKESACQDFLRRLEK